jgi:glycosyltransferase involved in cell wall biosynthesis
MIASIVDTHPRAVQTADPDRHVVFVIRSLNIGGAERQLIELARGLVARGWRVEVISFYAGGALKPELDAAGIAVEDLAKGGRWDILAFGRLVRRLRRIDAPIVHAYLGEANLIVAGLRPFVRSRVVVWGVRSADLSRSRQDWLSGLIGRINRRLARRADLIICNSRAGLDAHAADGYPSGRMTVIPNGVDTQRFVPDPDARHRVRDEWEVGSDELLVGLVGRLDPIKGHDPFLRAIAPLVARHRVRVVLVGTGPEAYQMSLEQLTRELGIQDWVMWSGPRTDMPAVYAALDLLVSASFGEGFSNVIAEAMSTGVPCVVTGVGDSADIVGAMGWVARPDDVEDLRRAIDAALGTSPEERASRSGRSRAHIIEAYDTERLIERTASRLSETLATTRR